MRRPPTAPPARSGRRGAAGTGLVLMGLIVLAFVAVFDGVLAHTAWTEAVARRSWVQVPAVVTASEVRVQSDADGSAYYPEARYRYELDGADYEGDRFSLGMPMSFGRAYAEHLLADFPVGARVTAWVDPDDPTRAALVVEGSAASPFAALFLLPFHCMGGVLLALGLARRGRRGQSEVEARFVRVETPDDLVLGKRPLHPAVVFMMALGGASFLAIFAVGLLMMGAGRLGAVPYALAAVVAAAAGITFALHRRSKDPARFLHVDLVRRTWAHPADAEPRALPRAPRLRASSEVTNTSVNDEPIHRHTVLLEDEEGRALPLLRFRGPDRWGDEVVALLVDRIDGAVAG